ncbi:glycerol-3-phosphate dehydrogenase [Pararhizobium capsulatum DSM 1112]|uniref:Glycerol-3-phosphate dehydrogenase n=1 Tax=Pararhizobium capsulatum DSM 1112 TaxID=1121113 RepID=A0ABU0BUJ7_9HYPH|nr:hypothetical protein [Pararhizobium capsulatum]MDQ0320527.1 glycerol-3-phosphate dehydrogenase [Pararhizobium capsulatum DSM 1112]
MIRAVLAACLSGLMAGLIPTSSVANDLHIAAVKAYIDENVISWIHDPRIVEALKNSNAYHQYLTPKDIDRLDGQWRTEFRAKSKPLISSILNNALSMMLRDKQAKADGIVTELMVMDAKGLAIGESDMTSDYWQGDELKWQNTYLAGPNITFVDRAEKDDSTQMLQAQASMTISDPETGQPIGAITVGVNLDAL